MLEAAFILVIVFVIAWVARLNMNAGILNAMNGTDYSPWFPKEISSRQSRFIVRMFITFHWRIHPGDNLRDRKRRANALSLLIVAILIVLQLFLILLE